ncbi:MAG: helix-turn-helix domain-containing protein [Actinomycetia bacterium]|nr:helix-turn-helix domain-containing protein [Actinomycetes bacterium]
MPETFGVILQEARLKRGLSLEQVSAELRIRPAILASLEREDYFAMPLKGWSRSMVSSYSRFLGLDSVAVTELFLQNYRDFEMSQARQDRNSGRSAVSQRTVNNSISNRNKSEPIEPRHGQGVRSMWDKPTPSANDLNTGIDSRSTRAERSARNTARRRPRPASPSSSTSPAYIRATQQQKPRGGLLHRLFTTTPLPLILLIVVIVALLIVWAVLANSCHKQSTDFIPVQPSDAATSTSSGGGDAVAADLMPTDSSDPVAASAADNYGTFTLKLDPAVGTGPWTTVYIDDIKVFEGALTELQTYSVTNNCYVETGQPGNLTAYRNDVAQTWTLGVSPPGKLTLQVLERPVNDATTNTPINTGTQ